jgi:uncharacterized membrane protein
MRREDLGLAGYRDKSSAFVRFLWVTVSIRSSYARSHRIAGGVAGLSSDRSGWCAYSRLVAAFRSVRLGRDVRLHRNGSFQQDETRSSTDDPVIFPRPRLIVYITGVLELLGAAGLVLPQFRRLAGICLMALLAGMFVANVNAAQRGVTLRGKAPTPLWLRTPMQILFIALLWWSTRV